MITFDDLNGSDWWWHRRKRWRRRRLSHGWVMFRGTMEIVPIPFGSYWWGHSGAGRESYDTAVLLARRKLWNEEFRARQFWAWPGRIR